MFVLRSSAQWVHVDRCATQHPTSLSTRTPLIKAWTIAHVRALLHMGRCTCVACRTVPAQTGRLLQSLEQPTQPFDPWQLS